MGRAFEYRKASKEKRWNKMSELFPKLAKAITIATKEGGADPDTNAKLRSAILNAKAQNLPKENIEAAIKRANNKDSNLTELLYEAKAQFGVMIIIDCASDNPTRTIANLKSYCNKHNAQIIPNGSLEFMFNKKAVFEIENINNIDEIELTLIDYGLEEIQKDEDNAYIYASYKNFFNINNALKKLNIESKNASLKFMPISPINLNEMQITEIDKLLNKLENDDDVQNVYTNINF